MENLNYGVKLEIISRHYQGYFGDPNGFEELLYSTKSKNSYLLVGKGGHESKYPENEIRELTEKQAQEYLIKTLGKEEALKIIPQPAKKPVKKAVKKPVQKPSKAKTK